MKTLSLFMKTLFLLIFLVSCDNSNELAKNLESLAKKSESVDVVCHNGFWGSSYTIIFKNVN